MIIKNWETIQNQVQNPIQSSFNHLVFQYSSTDSPALQSDPFHQKSGFPCRTQTR